MDSFTDYLCFRLGALTRRIQREYNNKFAELNITLGQSFVLFCLMEADGSSVKDIAAAVQLDPPAITGLVDRLAKEGLVERRTDLEDRRATNVYLTERGQEIAIKAGMIAYDFNEAMKKTVNEGNLTSFQRSLAALEGMITG
ncbi:MAG: MarR family winged helix-turn-helix transcriptional regulator [Deltaproteobacteria bacterium]